jgi:hypothetical protein
VPCCGGRSRRRTSRANQRILYEANVKDEASAAKYVRQSGSIPTSRVSFVGTATATLETGCSQRTFSLLRIDSSGGEIAVYIPTEREAKRLQRVIDELISRQ